ncbi:penicillin-insensitive murein endopeptidase [Pseudovibrio exalbescens]|uniref:penicillin-insensitive murein endopeptidase n=1 Tax=Pseudovibrio exalbescens TaxID=197461 RepID=UPI002366CEE2|nr:penicillin-insensitive murein endopeptidase [Pseudovibrio exalbescens]MDD7910025.1 penicillin-insensitive murein endopeptidase [Pseudovibrio exalbescens]
MRARRLITVFTIGLGVALAATSGHAMPFPKAKPESFEVNTTAVPSVALTEPAKQLFGAKATPAQLPPASYGSYSKGCIAGAEAMPINGPTWQVMRLSRNRNWGHPNLITYLKDLAKDAPDLGWNGLLVGDLAQPRGGPMRSGHASHQIGLDADIWLRPMPNKRYSNWERENVSAISMLKGNMELPGADRSVHPDRWTDAHARLIRRAAQDPRVARIFVSPAIKKALCEFETEDRSWLRTVRAWWGHHYHFHVRLKCPEGNTACTNQAAPPRGDGCGAELAWWLSDEPWVPKKPQPGEPPKPVKPKPQLTLQDLPAACRTVLAQP